MKMPPDDQLDIAAHWLELNEAEGAEGEACRAVQEWIDHEKFERMLREKALEAGIPVARLRRKLKEQSK